MCGMRVYHFISYGYSVNHIIYGACFLKWKDNGVQASMALLREISSELLASKESTRRRAV